MALNPLGELFSKNKANSAEKPESKVSASVRFAVKIFQQLAKEQPGQNVFISPASIHFVLSLVCNGATGQTRDEMAKTLELAGLSDEEIGTSNKILKTLLERQEPAARLAIANSLWSRKGVSFKPEYEQMAREDFAAAARELDFALKESADTINSWCGEHTNGKIDQIVSQTELSCCLLVLINALYFKGDWAEGFEFNESATKDSPFTLLKGGTKTVPLMTQFNSFQYFEDNEAQAVKIGYGERSISMTVILPAKGADFANFLKALTPEKWEAWSKSFDKTDGRLTMPKFTLRYENDLIACLIAMGMKRAFTEAAEFPKMTSAPVMIGAVKHKTFVEVNEKGTEAAAITAVLMAPTGARPMPKQKPFEMIVDRPFVCAIRDERTGTFLFLGAIVEP